MIKFIKEIEELDLSDYTLVLPAVSVGNVGQLAVDLLISNLSNCSKVGRVFHNGLEPVVGNETGENGEVSLVTSCECFHAPEAKLMILQFHAPVLSKCTSEFVEFLTCWISKKNVEHVICLSSTFASERIDSQLVGPPFRYLTGGAVPNVALKQLSSLGWKRLEGRSFPAPPAYSLDGSKNENGEIYVPGSGITKSLLEACVAKNIPLTVLLMFVSEGDNTQDSIMYFDSANQVFKWKSDGQGLKIPPTWVHLFGSPHPPEIY